MKLYQKISLIAGGIISVPLLTAAFLRKKYHVERKITIQLPKAEVFDYIKYLQNQDKFSKWSNVDPLMEKTYRGKDATVGFVSAWSSTNKEVGKGEQEIIEILEGERIDYELRFFEPFKSTAKAFMATGSLSDKQTTITWGIDGQISYPMNLMLLFMDFDKMLGDDLDQGLKRLKMELEK